jgi:hypothetical protein
MVLALSSVLVWGLSSLASLPVVLPAEGQKPVVESASAGDSLMLLQSFDLVCDDGDSCFSYNGGWNPPSNPNQYCKYADDMRFGYACWAAADCQPDNDHFSVFWRPNQVSGFIPGRYEVYAYISRCDSATPHTQGARYYLRRAGDSASAAPLMAPSVNQAHPYQDNNDCSDTARWVSLGMHDFDSGTYVELRAWTDESGPQWGTRHHVIFADAVRFSFRNQPPNVPQQVSPSNGSTITNLTPTLQVQDTGDIDNYPRNYRDYYYRIEKTDGTWSQEFGWTRDTTWPVTVPSVGTYRWRAQSGDGEVGSGWTDWWTFAVNNPVPAITGISPASATVGDAGFTLAVNGAGFVNGSVVRWNGSDRLTTFVSGARLQAMITAADIATVGAANITVYNPGPGGGTSNALMFTIVWPPDDYEADDACAQSTSILPDGTFQSHTFHTASDVDWVRFSVEMGHTYVLEAGQVTGGADVVLDLYATCTGRVLHSAGESLGPGARLVWTASSTGTLYLKVRNDNAVAYGPGVGYQLSLREQAAPGVAIIVAGHNDQHGLQSNIEWVTSLAYRAFTGGMLGLRHVYYLNDTLQDADGDGDNDVNAEATLENLDYAINQWAASRVSAEIPLYLYLADHGATDVFMLDGTNGLLTVARLDAWLDALEASTTIENMVVIVEACHSGSFIEKPDSLSKLGRVIISSTSSQKDARLSEQGAYFSDAFFTALAVNRNVYAAFEHARQAVEEATRMYQTPWIDDNGDAVADGWDGQLARRLGLANSPSEEEPVVLSTTVQFFGEATGVIAVLARDNTGVDRVWAEIYPPSFVEPAPGRDFETPELDIPRVDLQDPDGDDVYSVIYTHFDESGLYRVVVYASDEAGYLAAPQGMGVRIGLTVYVPLVLRR